jgi:signal transduction protein with GAF and PtsI domain
MPQKSTDDIAQDKLKAMMEMAALVNSSHERPVIMDHAVKSICRLTDAEAGSLLLVDDFTGHLDFEVVAGEKKELLPFFRVPKGQGIAGWVAEHNTPLIVPDVQSDERFFKFVDNELNFVTRDMIAVPLRAQNDIIGVLQVLNKRHGTFNHDDLKLAMAFANQIAAVINKSKKDTPRNDNNK